MRKMLIGGALLLAATPALANWGSTRWGMTPEQVIARVFDAEATEPSEDTDILGMHQLAEAPATEGRIKLIAGFYFKPDTNGLALVDLNPEKREDCGAFRDALIDRLGKGIESRKTVTMANQQVLQIAINWNDPSGDRLVFGGFFLDEGKDLFAGCALQHWAPA